MNAQAAPVSGSAIVRALRSTAEIIWAEADRYTKWQLVFSFGLLVVGSVLGALVPVIYKMIIDAFSGVTSETLTPVMLLALYIGCSYVLNSSSVLRQLVHSLGTQRLNRRLSNRLFGHLVRLPLRFHLDRKTGAIGETLGQGLAGCQILLQHAVFTFLPVIIEFLAIIVVLIHLQHSAYLAIMGVTAIAYGYTFWRAAEQSRMATRSGALQSRWWRHRGGFPTAT
jgi:ABC-type multidrug transport system fused ATPase/permease subunit